MKNHPQTTKPQSTVNDYIIAALAQYSQLPALSNLHSPVSYTYSDVAREIGRLHIFFRQIGLHKGDHVALCARNSAEWAIAFLAIVTYGAVAVSILADFRPDDIAGLVKHSDAKLLLTDSHTARQFSSELLSQLDSILLANLELGSLVPFGTPPPIVTQALASLPLATELQETPPFDTFIPTATPISPSDPVVINYTSGSTGSPKGVVLPERAIWSNIQYSIDGLTFLQPGDSTICMLPLAHMFGLLVDLLHAFVKGCHIHFVTRTPSPAVIMDAFASVRPKLIVSVPLVIEKIIRKKVFPQLERQPLKTLWRLPLTNLFIRRKLHDRLIAAFGGNLQQLILGGAGVSADVEAFLRQVRFPFTVGYGMTETGPLIGYAPWDQQRPGTCGHIVDRMSIRVDSPDPANIPGTLWVKGDNLMTGYYKNPSATDAVMGTDGWMNTGDTGTISPDGLIAIRGRDKNMILGPSGQNIYPEEIEALLNAIPPVAESLIIDAGQGRLKALIYLDPDATAHLTPDQQQDAAQAAIKTLNAQLPAYEHIADLRIMPTEFEKTPKRSIRRFLYTK
ncbi:MAG: AMP-binding protein [Pseudoflavonifractor sp.]|nr:AMP-binding protein [Alloprevotella sp.]MCM1116050.1 AMP-binding protein [Pseudoflavonifractor sp.]